MRTHLDEFNYVNSLKPNFIWHVFVFINRFYEERYHFTNCIYATFSDNS